MDFIQADVSNDLWKFQLIEHIRTRFTHHRPACVQTVTVFANLNQYSSAVSDETPAVSITIVGYVQGKSSRISTMKSWMSSAAWDPVCGGLYSNGEFLSYMDLANNPSMPGRCMRPIFGEVGLNNDCRLGAKRDREVFVMFHCATLSFLTVCSRCFPCRGRAMPPDRKKELSEKRADNNPRPPNTIRKLDPTPRSSCHAIPFFRRPRILRHHHHG
jgi:hypothetical protein